MRRKKRRERGGGGSIHPRNKYAENPPDFSVLASLYPSFSPYVFFHGGGGTPHIDWTDYNATRELTGVLLLHDHNLHWWIPDGQLCPTVPNRSNYIHWIEDLLLSDIIPRSTAEGDLVRGFDIGTGANCIYPLLGASLLGWSFVGSDVTDIALEWAEKNVKSNPHIQHLIEIRRVAWLEDIQSSDELQHGSSQNEKSTEGEGSSVWDHDVNKEYCGPPILLGVVRDDEKFDFCMCNPPFFETMEAAGLNPKTSCGGTSMEMVCAGGEKAFIARIIEDSAVLRESFRWYTSMVGRKTNLKFLTAMLREIGVTIVKTTEFVQGKTCRWGLAWSFVPPARKIISPQVVQKSSLTFTLEGLQHQYSAMDVLQSIEFLFRDSGASCKSNPSLFSVDITASKDHCDAILKNDQKLHELSVGKPVENTPSGPSSDVSFRILVFQQIPGTLLVKGSLQRKDSSISGMFSSIIQHLEEVLRCKFCKVRVRS